MSDCSIIIFLASHIRASINLIQYLHFFFFYQSQSWFNSFAIGIRNNTWEQKKKKNFFRAGRTLQLQSGWLVLIWILCSNSPSLPHYSMNKKWLRKHTWIRNDCRYVHFSVISPADEMLNLITTWLTVAARFSFRLSLFSNPLLFNGPYQEWKQAIAWLYITLWPAILNNEALST